MEEAEEIKESSFVKGKIEKLQQIKTSENT